MTERPKPKLSLRGHQLKNYEKHPNHGLASSRCRSAFKLLGVLSEPSSSLHAKNWSSSALPRDFGNSGWLSPRSDSTTREKSIPLELSFLFSNCHCRLGSSLACQNRFQIDDLSFQRKVTAFCSFWAARKDISRLSGLSLLYFAL